MLKQFYDGARFRREHSPESAFEVVKWWESRRLFFNVVVGLAGIVSCITGLICAAVDEVMGGAPVGVPDGPLLGVFAIIFYGILANICYSGGWMSELIVRSKSGPEAADAYAIRTFRFGIQLSVFLTILPAAICWITFAVSLVTGYKSKANVE